MVKMKDDLLRLKTLIKRGACLLLLLELLCFSCGVVSANAAMPPAKIWLALVYDISPRPEMVGAQFVGCETEACESPIFGGAAAIAW